jgi:uncharacterized membrane protein
LYKETIKKYFSNTYNSTFLYVLIIVSFALRFYRLGYQSLWNDEILSVQIASSSIIKILTVSFWRDTHQPLYYLVLHFFVSISRDEMIVRLTSVIFGVLCLYIFYLILKQWFGKDVSLVGTLLMATSAFHVWYSQETRPYMMMLFFALLAFFFLQRLMERKTTLLRLGFILSAAATYYCQSISLPFLLFLVIYVFIHAEKPERKYWTWTFIYLSLLLAPTFLGLLVNPPSHSADKLREVNVGQLLYIFWAFCTGYSLGPSLRDLHFMKFTAVMQQYYFILIPMVILIISLAIIGFKKMWTTSKQNFFSLFIWITLPGLFVVLGAAFTSHAINVRYVILVFPAYLIVITVALLSFRFKWVSVFIIVLLIFVNVYSLTNYFDNPKYQRENTKAAAKFLTDHTSREDLIIASASYTTNNLNYYYSGKATILGYPQKGGGYVIKSMIGDDFKRLISNREYFWLFLSRTFHSDPRGLIKEWCDTNYNQLDCYSWSGTQLVLYENAVQKESSTK